MVEESVVLLKDALKGLVVLRGCVLHMVGENVVPLKGALKVLKVARVCVLHMVEVE
jgi:hypothetical protein